MSYSYFILMHVLSCNTMIELLKRKEISEQNEKVHFKQNNTIIITRFIQEIFRFNYCFY